MKRAWLVLLFVSTGCFDGSEKGTGGKTTINEGYTKAALQPQETARSASIATTQGDAEPSAETEATSTSEGFLARVVSITDGDTIEILDDDKVQHTIRFNGIDTPERGQEYANRATQALKALIAGKQVRCIPFNKDRYGRTIGDIYVGDTFVNLQLVKDGWAWHYKYYSDDEDLAAAEVEAREAKRGLWADTRETVAPWDWRAAQREASSESVRNIEIVPNGVRIVALLPNPEGADAGNEQVTIENATSDAVSLQGWKLIDKAGNVLSLNGRIDAKASLTVTIQDSDLSLNNNGDDVLLTDDNGIGRSRVSYTTNQAQSGVTSTFAE